MKITELLNEDTSEHADFLAGYFDILMLTDNGWTKRVASTIPRERIGVVMKGLAKKYNTDPDDFKPVKAQGIVDEVSKPTLARYVKAAGKDVEQRASSQSFASGKRGDPYNKADSTHADTRREKGVDLALRKLTREQDVAEAQFNSKQEVINHFVKQGKSAAAGASAWERGWRGHAPKKSAKAPVRSYHDDLDDKRYGSEEGVAEGKETINIGDDVVIVGNSAYEGIPGRVIGFKEGKIVVDMLEQGKVRFAPERVKLYPLNKQGVAEGWGAEKQARDLEPSNRAWAAMLDKYSGDDEMTEYLKMFRISNWSAKNAEEGALKWISHGKPLPDWYLDIKAGKRTHGYKLAETATAGSTSAGNVGVGAVYKNKPAKQAKNKDGTAKNALDIKTNLLAGGSIKR